MTDVEKLTALRAMVGGSDTDEVLSTYLLLAEGQTQHSENGITRQYENADVPSSMLKAITPYCGVIK